VSVRGPGVGALAAVPPYGAGFAGGVDCGGRVGVAAAVEPGVDAGAAAHPATTRESASTIHRPLLNR